MPSTSLTAIVVADVDATPADVGLAVEWCRLEVTEVVLASVGPPSAPKQAGSSGATRSVRAATPADAVCAAGRVAATARCVVVDARQRGERGSISRFSDLAVDTIAVGARCSPLDHRDVPVGPAGTSLLRRSGVSVPTALLASGAAVVALDDVVATFRSFDRLARDGATFAVVEPPPPSQDGRGWRPDDARRFGREAVHLYRDAPETIEQSGLDMYRAVSYNEHLRRRVALLRRWGRQSSSATAFWRGVRDETSRHEWAGLTEATTVLMYHGFSEDAVGSRYVVGRRRLRRQLQILGRMRRRVISLDDYIETRLAHGLVPKRSVVITIDDGYADTYTVAGPELRNAGVTATMFVPTAHVGGVCDWSSDATLSGRRLATWEQLASGVDTITIGSHAHHHVALAELDDDAVDAELVRSAEELHRHLGRRAATFAYPYGADSRRTRERVEQSDYLAACTSHGGRNSLADPLHALRRVEVRGDVSLSAFVVAVLTGSTVPLHRQIRGRR